MRDFISLTYAHNGDPFTIALHAIGLVEPQPSYEQTAKAILTLSMGKSGKRTIWVLETYEEIIRRMEAAQQPAAVLP